MSFTRSKNAPARRRSAISRSPAAASKQSAKRGRAKDEQASHDSLMTPSSGNIFEDVGFPPDEARNLLRRAELMLAVERVIERRKLTQNQAAKVFGVSQPRISDLIRGKMDLFSIDTLI